ncbi:hypothetical protein [Nocardia sp. CNY236]|nr:hypothetical protein [Nocardia sp. CNY236]
MARGVGEAVIDGAGGSGLGELVDAGVMGGGGEQDLVGVVAVE